MFTSLLPSAGHVFGKERRMWHMMAEDGVEEETIVSCPVACGTRTKGPGWDLGILHRDREGCV